MRWNQRSIFPRNIKIQIYGIPDLPCDELIYYRMLGDRMMHAKDYLFLIKNEAGREDPD